MLYVPNWYISQAFRPIDVHDVFNECSFIKRKKKRLLTARERQPDLCYAFTYGDRLGSGGVS